MIDNIMSAVRSFEGVEEIRITVTTVTAKIAPASPSMASKDDHFDDTGISDGLSPSHRAALDAVHDGKTRPKEIEDATGLKHRRVAELLKELVESGHLVQPRYGRYQPAA